MSKKHQTVTAAAEPVRTGYFAVLADLAEAQVDEGAATIRNVTLIRPGFSTNTDKAGRPRYYPRETLQAAAAVFDGTRAYLNHPRRSDDVDLPERDVRDIAGYWTNVQAAADGRLLGDLRVVGPAGQAVLPLITEAIGRKPGLVDVSINALGTTRLGEAEGRKAVIIESIVKSNSVDIVTTGAAGGSFAGALLASDGETWTRDLLGAMRFEEWREARPEFVAQLKTEWKTTRETEALAAARAEIEQLKQAAASAEAQYRAELGELADLRRAQLADRLLAESALPHSLRGQVRGELLEAADEAGMQRVMARERAKWLAAPKPPVPVAGAGQRTSQPPAASSGPAPNPAAQLIGIAESAMPLTGESAEQYRARRLREGQAQP